MPTELRVEVRLFDAVDAADPVTETRGLLEPLVLAVVERDTLTERVGLPLAVPVLLTVEVVVALPVPVVVRLSLVDVVPVTVLLDVRDVRAVREELTVDVDEGVFWELALVDLEGWPVTDADGVTVFLGVVVELFEVDIEGVPVPELVAELDRRDDADAERVEDGVFAPVGTEVLVRLAVVDELGLFVEVVVLEALKLRVPLAVAEADLDRTAVTDVLSVIRAVEDADADVEGLRVGRDVEEVTILDVGVLLYGARIVDVEDAVVELLLFAVTVLTALALEEGDTLELPEDVGDADRVLVSTLERDDVVVGDADRDGRDVTVTSAELVDVRVALAEAVPERVEVVLRDEVVLAVAVRVGKIVAVVQEEAVDVLDGGAVRVLVGVCRTEKDG